MTHGGFESEESRFKLPLILHMALFQWRRSTLIG